MSFVTICSMGRESPSLRSFSQRMLIEATFLLSHSLVHVLMLHAC